MAKPFVSVIIPAFNEAKRLPMTLIDIDKHLEDQDYSYEILVVNDGSTDGTAEIVKRFSSIIENLKLIDNKINQGKGAAVKQGMLLAKGTWRLFMDADNSTSIVEFNKMLPYFTQKYEIVIGSRNTRATRILPNQDFLRYFLDKFQNLFIQALLLPGVWDTQCGFKCFSESAAIKLFNLMKLKGWGFDVELLALAKKMNFKIKELPIFWANDFRIQLPLRDYLQTLKEVAKVRWWLWKKAYNL